MYITCLDLEGVLVPEIWIAFAEESGIPELTRTTRDEPDYGKLMDFRLDILRQHGLGLKEIQETIARIDPLPGAKDFLDELRATTQAVIISDTFTQFAQPLMAKLGWPALFCNELEVADDGTIAGFRMRCPESKLTTVRALQSCGFDTIAAGDEQAASMTRMADVSGTARVRAAGGSSDSLFASTSGDIPLVAVNGAVYRMLSMPTNVESSLLGDAVGTVSTTTDEPSLADDSAMTGGLSNVAEAGQTIYAVSGVDVNTAVACEVGGNMRLFQRVSYAGKGPGGQGLEDTFSVRGQVAELTLSGVGTLIGDAANDAAAVLLDHATLKSADSSARKQTLTVTLTNGLKLQLGVSGDTVSACGKWSCPEFFEAFESGL